MVDAIYRTTCGLGSWMDVVARLEEAAPFSGIIFHGTAGPDRYNYSASGGFWDPSDLARYAETYHAISPWVKAHAAAKLGESYLASVACGDVAVTDPQFYDEFVRPTGSGAGVALKLYDQADQFGVLTLDYDIRDSELRDAEMLRFGAEIAPHVMRSVQLLTELHDEAPSNTSMMSVLAHAAMPSIVVDAGCRIRWMNAAGEAAVVGRRGVGADLAGHLTLEVPAETDALRASVRSAIRRQVQQTGPADHTRALPFTARGEVRGPNILRVLPIPAYGWSDSAALSWLYGDQWLALITIRYRSAAPDIPIATVKALLGLSDREALIALNFASGREPEAIAQDLGIREVTVINHLKSAMRKTDCHRRGDLALLVSRIADLV